MTKVISDNTLQRATGSSWSEWMERMDKMGARKLSYEETTKLLTAAYEIDDRWAQFLALRYSRASDRHVLKQGSDGLYVAVVTKRYEGTLDQALEWLLSKVNKYTTFGESDIETSSTTRTDKWRYYRAVLSDNSRVLVNIYQKTPTQAVIGVSHERLSTAEMAARQQLFWKSFLSSN